jgi:hypothetical protein
MGREERMRFVRELFWILVPMAATYLMLTAFRDYRDNFQAELFEAVGVDLEENKQAFSNSERVVAFATVALVSMAIMVRRHLLALRVSMILMMAGAALAVGAIFLRKAGTIDGMTWMVLSGVGTYLSYILVHCLLFERLVALTRAPGNSVFAMMLFDGIGYLGPIMIIPLSDLLLRDGGSRLVAFDVITWGLGGISVVSCLWVFLTLPRYRSATNDGECEDS